MTAKARVEFVTLSLAGAEAARDGSVIEAMHGAGAILSSTAASVQSAAAPAFPAARPGRSVTNYARVSGASNAVIVTPAAANPTATQTNGIRVGAGQTVHLPIRSGQKIAVIEATDA